MENKVETIKAVPTDHGLIQNLDGIKNFLTDALYEMGYDDTFVNTLIERNVIDFTTVDYTSHIIYQLSEHYGEEILCGGLEEAIVFEGLDASLTGELGRSWHNSKGSSFCERIREMIDTPIKSLGLKVVDINKLRGLKLTPELYTVKRNLVIDYYEFGMHLPNVDIVVYSPEYSRVIAVISCGVNLKNRVIDMAYWKLKLQETRRTAAIKCYLITTDLNKHSIAESDLDCKYVLTHEDIEESEKVKLFEHFFDDFKKVVEEIR